jgi:trimethylamine monooxygenase
MYDEEFDYVIVCSAVISRRRTCPISKASKAFGGRVLHAHDFRDAMEFKDKDVLIVGRSYSAEDIGSQCWKYGAKSVTTSYRSKPMGFNWPERFEERPLLTKLRGKTAHFKRRLDQGSRCADPLHRLSPSFPVPAGQLRLKTANRMWSDGLYKGVVFDEIRSCSISACRTSSIRSTCSTPRPGMYATSFSAA